MQHTHPVAYQVTYAQQIRLQTTACSQLYLARTWQIQSSAITLIVMWFSGAAGDTTSSISTDYKW